MNKRIVAIACLALALCFILTSASFAAQKETAAQKAKKIVTAPVNYAANVTKETAKVVADTGKQGTDVVVKEAKTAGQVVTGDVAKTKELIVEPITGTAETVKDAVVGTVTMPGNALEVTKEEMKSAEAEKK